MITGPGPELVEGDMVVEVELDEEHALVTAEHW
jgi:hypothetical protein